MILVCGDLHGDWGSINTLINKKNPDIVLQCGDFGWWPKFEVKRPVIYGQQKLWQLKGIKPKNTKVYFCDGNHEDHTALKEYSFSAPIELYDNVFYGSRGSTLKLPDGRIVLFAGGADSIDKHSRIYRHDWFPEEIISQNDLDKMLSLEKVDIVISHTCPTSFIMDKVTFKANDPSTKALDIVLEHFKPSSWYFGHWHEEITGVHNNTKYFGLDYPKHGKTWWKELEEA